MSLVAPYCWMASVDFSAYIDDLYLQGTSLESYVQTIVDTFILFSKLELLIDPNKSQFIPK